MKLALTIFEGRISPVFDVCREALVLTIENGAVVSRGREHIGAPNDPAKIRRIASLGISVLVCGAISDPLRLEIEALGVRVIGFVAGDVDSVVRALLAGRLPDPRLSMPGVGARRRRRGGRRSRGGGCTRDAKG